MTLDIPNHSEIFKQRDVRETPTAILTDGEKVPVGVILPWLKTFTGTPSIPLGYVECDGAVLNDPESVYDGETIPDLNGGIFLRGDTTSGGTGGTIEHTHANTNAGSFDSAEGTVAFKYVPSPGGNLTNAGTLPPYYNVVWIMRIK